MFKCLNHSTVLTNGRLIGSGVVNLGQFRLAMSFSIHRFLDSSAAPTSSPTFSKPKPSCFSVAWELLWSFGGTHCFLLGLEEVCWAFAVITFRFHRTVQCMESWMPALQGVHYVSPVRTCCVTLGKSWCVLLHGLKEKKVGLLSSDLLCGTWRFGVPHPCTVAASGRCDSTQGLLIFENCDFYKECSLLTLRAHFQNLLNWCKSSSRTFL